MTISGISSVEAYGQLQQYLNGLRAIDSVAIRTVQADRITYEVRVRGGASRLESLLANSSFLEATGAGIQFDRGPFGATGEGDRRLEYVFTPTTAGAAGESGMLPDVEPEF